MELGCDLPEGFLAPRPIAVAPVTTVIQTWHTSPQHHQIILSLLIPSLSMGVHGTLRYLNLTFMNLYCRTGFLRQQVNYLPSINSARYTQRILQTEKFHRIRESPSFPKKSIVYTRPFLSDNTRWMSRSMDNSGE